MSTVTTSTGGVRITYGPHDGSEIYGVTAKESTFGNRSELEIVFDYANLPAVSETDALIGVIPANSLVENVYLYISTDFDSTSGTTTLDVGVTQPDGTAVDPDGLIVDVTADGSNAGWVVGGGALVGASVGAADVQVTAVPSVADLTAGVATLRITYIRADA